MKPNPFDPISARAIHEKIEIMFEELNHWIEFGDSSNFDTTFLESLEAQWQTNGALSPKQIVALENIYEGVLHS